MEMEKHERLVLARFVTKMSLRGLNAALGSWVDFCKERKWLRGLLNRCLGGREVNLKSAAFRTWSHFAAAATEEELINELDELRALVESLKSENQAVSAKYNLMVNNMGDLQKKQQEQAMRSAQKMIQMMKGKAITSTMLAWKQFTKESIEEKIKMQRFVAKWKNQGVAKCFLAWNSYVTEEKKNKMIVKRFAARMNNGCLLRIVHDWKAMVAENKQNRVIIERFRKRFMNMEVAKSMGTWKEYRLLRKRARHLAQRILNRANNGQILSAWLPWVEFVERQRELEEREEHLRFLDEQEKKEAERKFKEEDEKRQIYAEVDAERAQREKEMEEERERLYNEMEAMKLAEANRKQQVGLKMIQKMMHGCLANTLQGWKDFVRQEKYYKTVMKRFAKRMQSRSALAALTTWIEYYKTRKWLRGLLNRCLGGKDVLLLSAGFRAWHVNIHRAALHEKHIDEVENLKAELESARNDHKLAVQSMMDEKQEMSQKLLKKFIYTMQNSCLGKCYSAWANYIVHRRHERKLICKVFGKVSNRETSAAFTTWALLVKNEREQNLRESSRYATVERALHVLGHRHHSMTLRQTNMKKSFVKWMLATYTVTLSNKAVKRLDNFLLMFAHAFSSAKSVNDILQVTTDCLESMINGSAGTLIMLDKKKQEMWTLKEKREKRSPMNVGIIGFVAKTSQSVYSSMFEDQRYDSSFDDVMLTKGDGSSRDSAKTWWGGNMPKTHEHPSSGGSPVVLR